MSTIEERQEYLENPFATKPIYGDFTSFYITIAICTVFGIFLFALNLICGCCSKYKEYWNDRFTGNRWLVAFWTATAHKQPPLDLTELQDIEIEYPNTYPGEVERLETPRSTPKAKRAFGVAPETQPFQYSAVHHKQSRGGHREEFVELQKPVAFLAMFVVLVIMLILKYGPEYLNLRNYTLTRRERQPGGVYAQQVQYA